MGKGKSDISFWQTKIRPSQLIFELNGIEKKKMVEICNKLNKRSSVKFKLLMV